MIESQILRSEREIQIERDLRSLVPKKSRYLGFLRDPNFRPSIAPESERITGKDRLLFEQRGHVLDTATVVRAPICLIPEGDTALFRQVTNSEEGYLRLKRLSKTLPTAAALLDAFRGVNSSPVVVWFSEDLIFAKTLGRAISTEPERLIPLLQEQSQQTAELLGRLIKRHPNDTSRVEMVKFSDATPLIIEAVHTEAVRQGFPAKDRRKLTESSAAVVASTHALFPLIVSHLGIKGDLPSNQLAGVQGPVHLETVPPHWLSNNSLRTVVKFVNEAAANWNIPHRSLMPCLYRGEPIAEYSAFKEEGPQLRRDQRSKLESWINSNIPFPVAENPIFGHGVGLMEISGKAVELTNFQKVEDIIYRLMALERAYYGEAQGDKGTIWEEACWLNQTLGDILDRVLDYLGFWL